jgi:hypothetical protein
VVAFDADDPAEFLDLVHELRATESSTYTASETPIFTCIHLSVERALDALDGEHAVRASVPGPGEHAVRASVPGPGEAVRAPA